MNKIVRFYNQNRRIIWITAIAIVMAIAVIHALNNIAIKRNNEEHLQADNRRFETIQFGI